MFFNSLVKMIKNYDIDYDGFSSFNHIDPNIVKYFQTEYGKEWKNALNHHLFEEDLKKEQKKAA